jgi:septal ring factor EnvC (AmiA/AmiB activator)
MTTAPDDMPACLCGHSHAEHESLAPQCSAARCECIRYRPNRTTPRVLTIATAATTDELAKKISTDDLLTIGRRSDHKRIAALAEKITGELADLRNRVADAAAAEDAKRAADAQRVKALAEIADLETKLAAAKARLKPPKPPAAAERPFTEQLGRPGLQCPVCGRTFKTLNRHAATHRDQEGQPRP